MKKNIGKILIIVLPILFAILLLYPTYNSSNLEEIERQFEEKALANPEAADSIKQAFDDLYGKALEDAKKGRLKLGLDLRGGMYVTLEVDVLQLLNESAVPEARDAIFEEVIEKTKEDTKYSDEETIDIFLRNFDEIARPKRKYLSDYFEYSYSSDLAVAEQEVQDVLRNNEVEAIEQAIQVIRQRVDRYGIAEPTIQKQGSRRILLELPGVTNEKQMLELLKTTARLEFKLVMNDRNLASAFYKIDQLLAKEARIQGTTDQLVKEFLGEDIAQIEPVNGDTLSISDSASAEEADSTEVASTETQAEADTLVNPYADMSEEEASKNYIADHPFTILFETYFSPTDARGRQQQISYIVDAFEEGDFHFSILESQIPKFERILQRADVMALLPDDIEFFYSAKAQTFKDNKGRDVRVFQFYALRDFQPKFTGEVITDAQSTYDPTTNQPLVNMQMSGEGSERWGKITGANIGKRIAIVLDDAVYSAPTVQTKIIGGSSQITGMADAEEARLLRIVLKAGALQAPVQTIEVRVVGPSLGEDSIRSGVNASIIAFAFVILFMIFYYRTGGFVADFAVLINIFLVISILAAFDGTLTLPGIAGLILTLGMAVDANILIYERIREEMAKGRSTRSAVDEGFKKSLSAILDSNITTFITGLILFYFGSGPIQGFAMTLMIGILGTLFTAIVLSRAIIEIMLNRGATTINFGQPKNVIND